LFGGGLLTVSFARFGLSAARPLGILAAILGAVLLSTAAGSCLLYRLFGFSTAK